MLTVHHLENSQSFRVLWLLEELDAPYHIEHYARNKETSLAPDNFKKLHPAGTSPCISDGEYILPESNAILEYLLKKYDNEELRNLGSEQHRVSYLYWFHSAQGSLMPLLTESLIFKRMISKSPAFIRPIIRVVVGKVQSSYLNPRLNKLISHIEQTLKHSRWFAGDTFTAADIVMGYCMEVAIARVNLGNDYPNIHRFVADIKRRPAYQKALDKNGPFTPLVD
ncbi:glutathione S-transferase [Pseudoalteromonas citrea]|uniref:glutathione transferase n=2 Tax=Pseudoalteromonas citrea TaxID=43655 RepID=A0AAD4FPN8_9GAMM|nr:glutathione S-transferase [Pseudoalteromonas citrea]KAF7764164.1 glutathione S-transferase [Pseudoalteromonas citrea]